MPACYLCSRGRRVRSSGAGWCGLDRSATAFTVIHACFGHWLHSQFSLAPLIFMVQLALTIPLAAASWYLFDAGDTEAEEALAHAFTKPRGAGFILIRLGASDAY